MAKSQQTFSKTEKEKKRLKKRQDKQKKMDARKADKDENGTGARNLPNSSAINAPNAIPPVATPAIASGVPLRSIIAAVAI